MEIQNIITFIMVLVTIWIAFQIFIWLWKNVFIPILKFLWCMTIVIGFVAMVIFREIIIDELGSIGFVIIVISGLIAGLQFVKRKNYYR